MVDMGGKITPEYRRQWAARNKSRIAGYARTYKAKHRQQMREYKARWRKANPDYWKNRNRETVNRAAKGYRSKHIERCRAKSRELHRKNAREANAVYIRQWLRRDGIPNPDEKLISAVQTYIKLKRYIKYGDTEKHRRSAKPTP